jgi:hypothetical protein
MGRSPTGDCVPDWAIVTIDLNHRGEWTMKQTLQWLAGALVLIAMVAALVYFYWRDGQGPLAGSLTAEEAEALIHSKNVGLGQLENQKLDEGLSAFSEIATKVPDDPLGPRNVAVARVLALGDHDEPAAAPLVTAAKEALAQMKAIEGETTDYHWLALRTALAAEDFPAASAHLDALTGATADDPAVWYARFLAGRLASGRDVDAQSVAALTKAFSLLPTNAWLLVEWLRETASQIGAALDALPPDDPQRAAGLAALKERFAQLPEQLATARTIAQAFASVIQAHTRVNTLELLDQATEAASSGELQLAAAKMRNLANVLLPHAAPEQQAVRRHPLEFVLDRFRPEFYTAVNVPEDEAPAAIDVRFAAASAWQVPAELQEQLGEIRDLDLADFDLDGRLDVLALAASKLSVWSRKDDPAVWQEIASLPANDFKGLVVQDLDADFDETTLAVYGPAGPAVPGAGAPPLKERCPTADVDVALYGGSGVLLIENRFDAQTKQRTLIAVAADKLPAGPLAVQAMTCADLEADGDLDLALSTASGLRLWRNSGEWQFADMSERSVLPEGLSDASQLLAVDLDRDVDIDLVVAAPSGGGWLENLRHGQFLWHGFAQELPDLKAARAIDVLDQDGNAKWDLLTGGEQGVRLSPLTGPPAGAIETARAVTIADLAAEHLLTWDYDNDGWEDCLAWSDAGVRLLRGTGREKFQRVELLAAAPPAVTRFAAGDFDSDGDLDLALVAGGRVQLLENQGGNKNHWIDVTLQAQQIKGQQLSPSGRVSPYGLGSLLELKAGQRYQSRIVRGQSTHFGLGQQPEADVIRVGWLNGVPQNIIRPPADTFVCEEQLLNTSCPYLYAWDGERFVFVTDLLWNAPLGLQVAEGQLAPWRDWEYLKIPGHQLAAKDGHYILQATAELWEADYFDHVRLLAVDHPADVEIYSNEKVGPPQFAEYKIHTVRQPRTPVSARNSAGRDLLPEIREQDGVYARPYERKLRQGVVEEHFIELNLDDVGEAQRVTLFLTGWVYPAATSINVALSQGGSIAPPKPPSLEVPDGAGGWKEALPFMGFPGGKTKTIAVELPLTASGVREHPDGDVQVAEPNREADASRSPVRLRIRTTMEFYWDHIFFTVDEPPAEVRTTELALAAADLHERGFSRVVRDDSHGPEQFLYGDVSTLPKWPSMSGRFTRYGDVLELLTARDDRLVVMGAGDETTLRFQAIDPPPAGWKRDFLLYSVGWDKDANLQTVLGQSSEPLPFQAMAAYPWPPDQQPPDSPTYREYLRKYQTRRQPPAYSSAVRRHNATVSVPAVPSSASVD